MPEGGLQEPLLDDVDADGFVHRRESTANVDSFQGDVTPLRAVMEIISGAWPQTVVVASRTLICTMDSAVVGHIGTDELAAAGFANMWIFLTMVVVWQGCGDTLIALTGQTMGAGNRPLAGLWFQTALGGAILFTIPIFVSWMFIGDIFKIMSFAGVGEGDEGNVIKLATQFGRLSSVWILPDAIHSMFCQWLNGLDLVVHTVPIHVFFIFFNFGANMLLVFGYGVPGWDGLGFKGSPIATAITTTVRLVVLVLYMRNRLPEHVWNGFSREAFTKARVNKFLEQCIPNALAACLEYVQFMVLTVMIAGFGKDQLAAHSSMMLVFDVASACLYGMMEGGSMKISKELGAGKPQDAKLLAKYLTIGLFVVACCVSGLFLILRNQIGKIFSNDPTVKEYFAQLATVNAATYFLIALTFASYAILQAQGRPNRALYAMLVGTWIVGMPMAYVVSRVWHAGWLGVWYGSIIGYVVMTVISCAAVWGSDWHKLSQVAQQRAEVAPEDVQVRRTSSFGRRMSFSP
eukprot:CAMPEP_0203754468 /NCGR_PEP_ID=MMETSP0098-20131031/8052_1 /ASSEMBLY_ACC=CAM_ASM_000208 /TAXON_ID=96639 /ORGANISM=" , Strain NY0313808BC1" /LENGTH=517 /DNA_ID=CAMNT_0050645493 /DNA_START=58 /DNA_END=1611 /DNA_ORIENTATION=-